MDVNRLHHLKTIFRCYKLATTAELNHLLVSLKAYAQSTNEPHGDKIRDLEAAAKLLAELQIGSEAALVSLIAAVAQPAFDMLIPHYDE